MSVDPATRHERVECALVHRRRTERLADALAARIVAALGDRPLATAESLTAASAGATALRLQLAGPPPNVIELAHVIALRRLLHAVRQR